MAQIKEICNCGDEAVQNAIINTDPNFFTTDPDKLLDMAEALVTQVKSHRSLPCFCLHMSQNENEPTQNYLVCLRTIALDCNFIPTQPILYKSQANWIAAAQNCEMILSCQNAHFEWYNHTAHTLCPFQKG